jgi:hypothetical protein
MKSRLIQALIVMNVLLAIALASLWVGRDGKLRNVRWQEPAAIKPNLPSVAPALARPGSDSASQFVATLDRPLFSPSRKPPPPVVVAQAPPPDPLANIQLFGVYGGAGGGGIIARVDGKMRRAKINEKIGDWTIKEVADRNVTFVRGEENRIIRLTRGQQSVPSVSVTPAPDPKQQMTGAQRVQEEERERLRQLNEMNARNGLPPIINR